MTHYKDVITVYSLRKKKNANMVMEDDNNISIDDNVIPKWSTYVVFRESDLCKELYNVSVGSFMFDNGSVYHSGTGEVGMGL